MTLTLMAQQIADLWGAGEYVPPFEFMITDADLRLVCGLKMNAEGVFRPLPDAPHLLRPLQICLVIRLSQPVSFRAKGSLGGLLRLGA
jgi:hypothetical protein